MNNLSSYYGLTDIRMSASEKDLPVKNQFEKTNLKDAWTIMKRIGNKTPRMKTATEVNL